MSSLVERMIRAAKLDVNLYEEVEADQEALGQAMMVVLLSSAAAAFVSPTVRGPVGMLGVALASLVGWFVWAWMVYIIGTKWLPEPQTRSDLGELLRTIGFSSAPGVIRIAGIIPGFRGLVFAIASIWMLVAMVIAVRQALDYQSTMRAVGVCVIGWIAQVALLALFVSCLAGPMGRMHP